MNISVIIPVYNPDKQILKRIEESIKIQKFDGKIEIIKVENGLGLADSLNYGIKKAKYEIIVSLHQDCIPENGKWLKTLIEPLKDKGVVASVSKVELPYKIWKKFDFFTRILTIKEQKAVTPLLDEKGCAYKKTALEKTGLFCGEKFKTAGEDFDMYIKLKKLGHISYPDCKLYHFHYNSFKKRLKKELQLANGFGALVKIHKKDMPLWYIGILKSIPILGVIFFFKIPFKRLKLKALFFIPLSFILNLIYSFGFWKGFLKGKETI